MGKAMKPAESIPGIADSIMALMARAEKGDRTALPALQEYLNIPEVVDLFGGDLARQAQTILIGKLSGDNLLLREAVLRKLDLLRADLAGPQPSPLERLLVERIVACWLHLHHLEHLYAEDENPHLDVGAYYQQCLERAQKRYLSAIKTLAMVRKMAVPVLQLNVGRNQVNVAVTEAES